MLRSGHSVRFTPSELEEFRKVGLDFAHVTSQHGLESALADWASTLAEERPDLLEKIAAAMAKAKGARMPAKLSAVASTDSAQRS